MKVLHIINNLGSGGAEKLLEASIPLFNKMKDVHADILLLTDKDNVFFDSLLSKGVEVNVIKYKSMYDPRNIFEIRKYIVNGEYDIVHSHTFPTQYWVALSSLFIRDNDVKHITTEHSSNNRRRKISLLKLLERYIYSKYDSIISVTENTKNNLVKWIGLENKQIVINNGVNLVDINEAEPYKKEELINGINETIKLICMVGRFTEAKDQPTVIRAISLLPDHIHLVLVGEGYLMSNHKELAYKLNVDKRVHFLGFRNDIARIIKSVDILVLSSHWEGLSLASLEGMASGKPFIASRVMGLEDLVDDAGVLFEHENYKELSDKIIELINCKKQHDEVVEKCIRKASEYSLSTSTLKVIQLYQDLLEQRNKESIKHYV